MNHTTKPRPFQSTARMTPEYREYRRTSGMAAFERNCPLYRDDRSGRLVKKYRIGGTAEHGRHHMFSVMWERQQAEVWGMK